MLIQKYSRDVKPVWADSFRPWLRTIGAENRIVRGLNDNYRGRVELALVHESHETTAVNVGRVDELQLEDLIACGQPTPELAELLGGEDRRARVLERERGQVHARLRMVMLIVHERVLRLIRRVQVPFLRGHCRR